MQSAQTAFEPRPIGAYLSCSPAEINRAIFIQSAEFACGTVKRIGEILVELEQITREELVEALSIQRIDRLRQCSLFAGLASDDLHLISDVVEEVRLGTGERLLRQHQTGDGMYAVVSGRFLLYRRDRHSEGVPVGVAVPGDALGARDYLSGGTRSASACAIEPSLVFKIRYDLLPERVRLATDSGLELVESLPEPQRSEPHPLSADTHIGLGKDALLDHIALRACHAMQADRACVFLMDSETGDLVSKVTNEGQAWDVRVRPGAEVVGWVAQTGQLVNLQEAYLDPRFNPEIDVLTGYWTRTLLAGPVRGFQETIVGVVQVVNRNQGQFSCEDEVLLRAVACQSRRAIEACRRLA